MQIIVCKFVLFGRYRLGSPKQGELNFLPYESTLNTEKKKDRKRLNIIFKKDNLSVRYITKNQKPNS
ncbi:hypothetical protein HMPREF3213_00129 [Heyndrickxia coagulans]|uniref:Uncharacterized protein n=1 Tax=Heyndrickxia coagulans TaxID=1398 RepID=A0A133L352_HEYCO|nr:hypothetical protein HMPREF3213_00129 [Heyndrickxia coagulans]